MSSDIEDLPQYQVSFNSNGGTAIASQMVERDSNATKPDDPTKDESIFGGWCSDEGCTTLFNFDTPITSNTTLYALWTLVTYKITFTVNDGSYMAPIYVSSGYPIILTTEPTKENNTFGGWYNSASLVTKWDFDTPITEAITLYAKWHPYPVITFSTGGGSKITDVMIVYNTALSKPVEPTYEGYTFGGWYEDAAYEDAWDFSTLITEDMTLYANWGKNPTITYNTDGGDEIDSHTITYNTAIPTPATITKEGYTFGGWYEDASFEDEWNFATLVTENTTIYAKWGKNPTITYNTDGGSEIDSHTIAYSTAIPTPTTITKEGYTFGGWYEDASYNTSWNFSTLVTENTTLYAKWSIISYTVTFASNGGTAVSSQTKEYGSKLDNVTTSRTGYTFDGWYTPSNAKWDFGSDVVTATITLTAQWTINTYYVTFYSNGGTEVSTLSAQYLGSVSAPTAPTKEGYTFGGWYTDDTTFNNAYTFGTALTADVKIYALWYENPTVTFESNGGSEVSDQTITYNKIATEPTPSPTKTGYDFAGWYTDNSYGTKYDFSSAVTTDITLYAKWSIDIYTVTFNSNSGSSVTSQYPDYNTKITEPATPTRTGYTFGGWYTDNTTFNNEWDFDTDVVTGSMTLYAKWTINTYYVTFYSNGGSTVSQLSAQYLGSVSEPTAPTKESYTFGGWYTDEGLTSPYTFGTAVTSDFDLYALWYKNPTISFETNGGSTVSDQTITYNTIISEPSTSRTDHTFGGWYTNSALTIEWDFDTKITADITLYAKWINTSGTLPDMGTDSAW